MDSDRIILEDRNNGIDPGIIAMLQNSCKGNMDPAAMLAMMNNNGMGANGGWWWIFIIILFWMWGGNGMWGRNGQSETNADFARLAAMGNNNNNTDLLMQAINGNKDAINSLASAINCDSKSISQAICAINNSVDKVAGQVGYSSERVINAIASGDANLASQLANCCCTTQRSIDAVNLNLTKMSYEDKLAICNQTNTLLNTMNNNTLQLRDANTANTNAIIAKIDGFENMYRQDKYNSLLAANTSLTNELSQLRQNQYITANVTNPILTQVNALQGEVDSIKCKMPPTVSVPYPQITAVNSSCYNAAAMGAAAGTFAAERYGYPSSYNNCGC